MVGACAAGEVISAGPFGRGAWCNACAASALRVASLPRSEDRAEAAVEVLQREGECGSVVAKAGERVHQAGGAFAGKGDGADTVVVVDGLALHEPRLLGAVDELGDGGLWELQVVALRRESGCGGGVLRAAQEAAECRPEGGGGDDLGCKRVLDPDVLHHAMT